MWICKKCSAINNDDELAVCQNCGQFNMKEKIEEARKPQKKSNTKQTINKEDLDILENKMKGKKYKIEEVGMQFSDAGIEALESQFNDNSKNGWDFHSVIEIQKQTPAGCLGTQTITTTTYLAVYTQ